MSETDERYFCFSASLRISGAIRDPSEISEALGLKPTHTHRRGERRRPSAQPYADDMWIYDAPVDENRPLSEHLLVLWSSLRPHVDYLKQLKRNLTVDVFCGYRSNCDTAGFDVDYKALEIFREIEVPLSVSVILS